ncbi:hypothetical protein GGD70_007356 [Paraburkholderia fungorum]|jgi:hypothetical protein|nr:hypothetical protein [Paraburkholderia fungorum]
MTRRQIESSYRTVMEDDYRDNLVRVVAGYEIRSDRWSFMSSSGVPKKRW